MYTLDASVFARTIDRSDPAFPECEQLLELLRKAELPIVEPVLLLAEIAGAVARSRRDPIRARIVVTTLTQLPNVRFVTLDLRLAQIAADIAADHRLRGADAVYVTVAHHFGTKLVTLDDEQRLRAAKIVDTRTPAQVIEELARPHGR